MRGIRVFKNIQTRYLTSGNGIAFVTNFVRNRTNNDINDPFYNPETGQQNRFLAWYSGEKLKPHYDFAYAIYIKGYANSHTNISSSEKFKDW